MDDRCLENLARLGRLPDNEPFRQFLAQEREKCRDKLETASVDAFLVIQGRARMLAELQDLMAKSSDWLDKKRG